VSGSGFRVWDLELRVEGLLLTVKGKDLRVQVERFGFRF
jgi:hypothetical protein